MRRSYTQPIDSVSPKDYSALVDMALSEDCPERDVTSESIFSADARGAAKLVSREFGILCGVDVINVLNEKTDHLLHITIHKKDMDAFYKDDVLCEIEGPLITLLRIERILLNFIQYLSGIATQTFQLTDKYPNLVILDTRKTLPGYRKLVKYAVFCGGGSNHRINLSDMAMIKDNHVAMAGSISEAVRKIRDYSPKVKVELEIDSLSQLEEAIQSEPDILLLDNFNINDTYTAINLIQKKNPAILVECSGGITPDKLDSLSKIGGIGVSMGYLTHTTRFLDLSLEIYQNGIQ